MDLYVARWRTSSFSGGSGNSCVEVAFLHGDRMVAVRDTKDRSLAPHSYTTAEWAAFVTAVRAGEFNRPER